MKGKTKGGVGAVAKNRNKIGDQASEGLARNKKGESAFEFIDSLPIGLGTRWCRGVLVLIA